MSNDTVFVSKVTHINAAWLNPVNVAVFRAIGTGTNGIAPTTPADVRTNLGLTASGGAALIGNDVAGGSLGANVQAALDLKLNASAVFTNPIHQANVWDDANTPGNAEQFNEYTTPASAASIDAGTWVGLIHNQGSGGNTGNLVALIGHAYHDATFNNGAGAVWGLATEAWSNPTNTSVLIGGELSVIQQTAVGYGSVGVNAVFKNRSDIATHPTAPVVDGSLYNFSSRALYITSQARPSGGGIAWAGVGSGWQTAIKVGDPGYGSGLDWEGGSNYPQSTTYKAYSTVIDMTDALSDLAGGTPWFTLYRNASTYWGMRFNGVLTGQLQNHNFDIAAGGAGYAIGDRGTIGGAGGNTAVYQIGNVAAGVVTDLFLVSGGVGYVQAAAVATTATTGAGAGLTLNITKSTGSVYGAWLDPVAGGAGYVVGELVSLSGGGTAGYKKVVVEVKTVAAGVVTAVRLRSGGTFSLGNGYTVAVIGTTSITGAGVGLTVGVSHIWTEQLVGGEKWEFWRMLNPGDPFGTGARHGYIDASFPGTPLTIDTSGATYTFPLDPPL